MAETLLTIEDAKRHLGPGGKIKDLVRHISVVSRIDAFLEDLNVEPPAPLKVSFDLNSIRHGSIFHPSSIGSTSGKSLDGKYSIGCARLLYYDYIGAEQTGAIEPRLRRIFDTGSAIHAQLQAYLGEIVRRSEGVEEFTPEAFFHPGNNKAADSYDIAGSTDGIYVMHEPANIRFGVEIKSINDAGYQKTTNPHAEHLMQGTVYQHCLDLPAMLFVYYNKNDSSMAEFVQVYDERRWDAIAKKLDRVREMALKEEEPEREDGWHCMTCKYKAICNPPKKSKNEGAKMFNTSRRR